MAFVRVSAARDAFEKWVTRLGWAKEAEGVRVNKKNGARAMWHEGAVYVRVADDKPTLATNTAVVMEREFGGKATTPETIPPEVGRLLGEAQAAPAPEPTPADDDPLGGKPLDVEPEDAGTAAGADAKAAVTAVGVGAEIGGAVERAAEEARDVIDAAKAKRRAAAESAAGAASEASEAEGEAVRRLRDMGLDVSENAAPTGGFIVGVSIVAKTRLTRVIDRDEHTRKFFKRLGSSEDVLDNARRRARRLIEGEGGTPFMGTKLVPAPRLPILLKELHRLRDEFYNEVEHDIGGKRDEINERIEKAVRKHEGRAATNDDLIPKDVRGMFDYRIEVARMAIPRSQELQDLDVDLDTARQAIDNVLRTSREVSERAILRRFGPAYKSLSQAWEAVSKGRPLNPKSRDYLKEVVKEIEAADTTKNPVVRAELEKLRAYAEFVLDTAAAGELKKAQAALAKAVGRVTQVHNATAPLTGAGEVQAPAVGSVEDGLKAITQQIKRDMKANEERYGLSVEPDSKDKVNIRKVRNDGSAESARQAWLAYAEQFERLVVKG